MTGSQVFIMMVLVLLAIGVAVGGTWYYMSYVQGTPLCPLCPAEKKCPECKACPLCPAEKKCPECKACPLCPAEKKCPECKPCAICPAEKKCPECKPCPTVTTLCPKCPLFSKLEISTDGKCGPNNNNTQCPPDQCCSSYGFCGKPSVDTCYSYFSKYHGVVN